jgi:hypothetical protein
MLWMGILVQPYTVIPVLVVAKVLEIGIRGSPNDIVVTWLRL